MEMECQAGFDELPLGDALRETLRAIGYHTPTPIQAAFIPEALAGRDLIGQARTGTGKTAAFSIPIIERIDEELPKPQALVLGPTRELVCQVYEEAKRLAGARNVRIAAVYGGASMTTQIRALKSGAQFLVGTPGRVIDLLRRQVLQTSAIRMVVLDEADRMLDIGFRPDIEVILRRLTMQRQTMLLSATMPPPVLRLTRRYMHDPLYINLSADEVSVETIEQRFFTVDEDRKLELLLRLLVRERPRQCIVFCQRKVRARWLAGELGRRIRGVMEMSGDLPQNVRERVMRQFRSGDIRVLVATDVVGRGIDVQGISHVINYDVPEDPEMYVHRIGRTGRMGNDGTGYVFVTPDQGRLLSQIEIFINKQIRGDQIAGFESYRRRRDDSPEIG